MTDRPDRRHPSSPRHHTETAPSSRPSSSYRPPQLVEHGSLGTLVRGASWKGVDSVGELNPDENYPG